MRGLGGKEGAQRCPGVSLACCSSERVEKPSFGLSCFCVGSGENQRGFRCGARALGCQGMPDKAPHFPVESRKESEEGDGEKMSEVWCRY